MNPSELSLQVDRALGPFHHFIEQYRNTAFDFSALPVANQCNHYTDEDGVFGICDEKSLIAANPCYNSLSEEFLYYSCMIISSIRECSEFTDSEKIRAEAWVRRFLLERFPMNVFVVSFCLVPDTLSGWRTYAPVDGYSLGFNLQALKKLVNEKDSFSGRVYYDYRVQGEKILDKVKKVLPFVADAEVESGSEADMLIERRLYMPISKLIGFLKNPRLSDENEFRLVFLSPHLTKYTRRRDGIVNPYTKISLEPYLLKTSSRIFDTVHIGPPRDNFMERRNAIEHLLQANQLTCGGWHQSDVPYQESRSRRSGGSPIARMSVLHSEFTDSQRR
ncbi:DUF2971 domain-containing protein [Mesorhizobium sp. IMUNJ 23232]|uniref:DUF2971 domain-containing protein n=1 Tax=Mesorhizobium sp. IMUNJ 23232 TaxID=3376064 RepID=UPI00379A2C6C